jgi:elongation factor G
MGEAHAMDKVRNVCLVGHGGTGKTTLVEAILYHCKATTRQGKVEDGTALGDYTVEEKERRSTLKMSVLHAQHEGYQFLWIDTPGYADFVGEAISGLNAADIVLVAVNAVDGITVNTRRLFRFAQELGRPTGFLVTKMDVENIHFGALLDSLREQFGDRCIPLVAPVGVGPDLKGAVNVLDAGGALPAGVPEGAGKWREKIVDAAVETDDALLESYLEGKSIDPAKIETGVRAAIARGKLHPVFCVSTAKGVGVAELVKAAGAYFPHPGEVPPPALEGEGKVEIGLEGPFLARVFKGMHDDYVGRLTYIKVYQGRLPVDGTVLNARTGKTERIQNLFVMQGKEQKPAEEAVAGRVYSVSKIETMDLSDTLCDPHRPLKFVPIQFPRPMVSLAAEPKSRQDEGRLSGAMAKLSEEDKTFWVQRDQQTAELVITGMSQLHLEMKIKVLKRKFNVEVATKIPKVPYRETITGKGDAKYRHKKQTGGAGQFAEVWMRIEPLVNAEGKHEGFEYESAVVGGSISTSFIPSIEKGVRQVLVVGPVAGYPVVGVKAIVYDGKEHPVDSKDIAFQIAGREVFKLAMTQAKPKLLEPIMTVEVSVPSRFMGDITGDLNSRRGRISGMSSDGDVQTIQAIVPLAELQSYSTQIKSLTADEGMFTMTFSHYEIVPEGVAQTVIQKSQAAKEEAK